MSNKHDSKVSKVYQVGDDPTYSKVDKVYVVNQSGSGGGVADEVAWENVTGKPSLFPPTEHNHDDRYNTKEQVSAEIDFVRQQMVSGQGRVSATASDEPGYLESKVDNTTVKVEGTELVVKSIDGLTVGAADISTWLAGTSDNVQTQIDDIIDNLVALTSGMHYRGRLETFAELQGIGNLNNGDLAVVLADETREGSRSMYVYNEANGIWEFIGAFTFSDRFTSLSDTPESLDGQDGKSLVARGGRVVLENVKYVDLDDKPESTITQIDDAVAKRHEHSNKESLDKITVNNDGDLVVDGKVIELKPPELPEKEFVYANARSEAYSSGTLWKWHHRTGNISFDTNGGILLKAGKSYKIDINVSFGSNFDSWKVFGFVDAETGELAPEAPTANMALMKESSTYTEAHSRTLSLIMTPQTTRRFGVTITSGASPTTNATMYSRSSITIVEI